MKTYLTDTAITECCHHITDRIKHHYPHYTNHINLLYLYGLRISETFMQGGMLRNENGNIILQMPKTNLIRTIQADEFTASFNLQNHLLLNTITHYNIKSLERAILTIHPYRRLYVKGKPIVSHIFRHNYAKQLFNQLHNEDAVKTIMGEQELKSAQAYIHSKIYY